MPYSGMLAVPIDHDNKTLKQNSLSPITSLTPHLIKEDAAVSLSHTHQNLTFSSVYSEKVKQRIKRRDPSHSYERDENVTQLLK